MAIKGLNGFRYAFITSDTDSGTEYSEIKRVLGDRSIKITPKVASGTLYGDNSLMKSVSEVTEVDVEIDITELNLETRSDLLGYEFENGVLKEGKNKKNKEIAFGLEAPTSNDETRMIWLTKGVMEPLEEEAKTQEDKVEFQTQKVKFKFMPRVSDGLFKLTSDTGLEGSPTIEEFFTTEFLKTGEKPSRELKEKTSKLETK